SDAVADQALQLRDLRKASRGRARPHTLAIQPHLEHAALSRDERYLSQVIDESRKQLLRHPGSARQPAALGAILDFKARRTHAFSPRLSTHRRRDAESVRQRRRGERCRPRLTRKDWKRAGYVRRRARRR